MLVGPPRLIQGDRTVLSASVGQSILWFSVPNAYGEHVTTAADPFLIGLLLAAMKAKEPLEIRGSVSARLMNKLPRLMSLLCDLIKGIAPVEVHVDATHQSPRSTGVASGFSGGIDSFCLLADHMSGPVKLTHLVYNKVGAHQSDQVFREHFERLFPAAERIGLPMLSIESNLDDFVPFAFQQSHTMRNVAAVMVLQSLFGTYLYASGFSYRNVFAGRSHDMASMDVFILPTLSTEQMQCVSVGSEYTRVEKTLRVATVPESYELLDVCVQPRQATRGRPNCSTCWKCCRTQLTLEIAGKLHHYRNVFDMEAWDKVKPGYLRAVRSGRSAPLLREVDEFARQSGYRMPSMIVSQVASVPRRAKETAYALERTAMELAPRGLKDRVKSLMGIKAAAAAETQ